MRFNRELLIRALSEGRPIKDVRNRATGVSTVLALRAIANAIEKGGEWVEVKDHWETECAHMNLLMVCQDMVKALGLTCFEFRHNAIRGYQRYDRMRCTFSEAA